MHTRQKAKLVPKSCAQDFRDVSDALREICLSGMQAERNLCAQLTLGIDLLIFKRLGKGAGWPDLKSGVISQNAVEAYQGIADRRRPF
ncbi:hypothetical protein [Rhizobium leguminosarum]|uniref:Uncharacterized protein n=1 Tax=Rhizobium leguminosarum TaxID=384 RepID=A0A7X0DWH5_RHILE|nr:hypothetical protein [Rhizobium leguminosarum]MBB6224804.1 hypothetical protein [Rhizobium leguminosarum]